MKNQFVTVFKFRNIKDGTIKYLTGTDLKSVREEHNLTERCIIRDKNGNAILDKLGEVCFTPEWECVKSIKQSIYWKHHLADAPLTRDTLNKSKVKVVQYHTAWDDEEKKYKYSWSLDTISMKKYLANEPRLYTRKAYEVFDEHGTPKGNSHFPTVRAVLAEGIINQEKESVKRRTWARVQTEIEEDNQDKINLFKCWEALQKAKSIDKYHLKENLNDSRIKLAKLKYKEVTTVKREYFKELWLDRAADYGVYPQEVNWNTKDISTLNVAPVADPKFDPDKEPMGFYWLRPWTTYHRADTADELKTFEIKTLATKYTVTEIPSYKEDEAFAIAKGLCKLGGDKFLEKTPVLATPENNDYEKRMQLALAYVKAHKDELPPMELVAKAMALYEIPATQIVTKTDKSTGKEYTELVTGETNGYITRRDVRLGDVEDEDPLVLRDFQVEIDTVDTDEFDEAAYLGYTDEVLSEEEEYTEDEEDEEEEQF